MSYSGSYLATKGLEFIDNPRFLLLAPGVRCNQILKLLNRGGSNLMGCAAWLAGLCIFSGIMMVVTGCMREPYGLAGIVVMFSVGGSLIFGSLLKAKWLDYLLLLYGAMFIPMGIEWGWVNPHLAALEDIYFWRHIGLPFGVVSLVAGIYSCLAGRLEDSFGQALWFRLSKLLPVSIGLFIVGVLVYSFVRWILPAAFVLTILALPLFYKVFALSPMEKVIELLRDIKGLLR